MAQALSRIDLESAIAKYGPILQIHRDEKYDICSVEWFLNHSTLIDSQDQANNIVHPTAAQLPQGPKQGTRYYLEIENSVKSGNFPTGKAYINALWKKDTTYTDIQFWFFNAYNGPGTAKFDSLVFNKVKNTGNIDLSPLGEHVGDWEFAAVRIDNVSKSMIAIILSQHGKYINIGKGEISRTFKMVNGTHPVIYASLNGHANFAGTGPNFTEHRKVLGIPVGLEFNILNSTADGGKRLDCSIGYEIVAAEWLNGTPDAYSTPPWVTYPYRWGAEGTAINMDAKTLGAFIKAALGNEAGALSGSPIILLASELLHIFVKSDINGSSALVGKSPWTGQY